MFLGLGPSRLEFSAARLRSRLGVSDDAIGHRQHAVHERREALVFGWFLDFCHRAPPPPSAPGTRPFVISAS